MWQLLFLALLSAKPERYIGSVPPGGTVVDGLGFGPRLTLTCTWFTNFENSKFEQCRGSGANLLPPGEEASIKCLARTCDQLDDEARRVAHWRKREPPWRTFAVRIIGRIGLNRHPPEYLGDGTRTVLIEKLLSVRPNRTVR
jgi:hypothetical protein